MNQDLEHLRLLSIFHYVVAAIAFVFCLFPIIYVVLGGLMVSHRLDGSAQPPPQFVGWLILVFGLGLLLCGLAFVVCLVLAGRYLEGHRHHTFCLVMAALACTFMPFGTVLGVFTIIVLIRPSVRDLFPHAVPPAKAS